MLSQGYDGMVTLLGTFRLGFFLFFYVVSRLMFVYFSSMNDLLCLRDLACILLHHVIYSILDMNERHSSITNIICEGTHCKTLD